VSPAVSDSPDIGAGLPIHEASRVLGVPAPTLRSWERRHELPTTARSPGGHRRYSLQALTELRLMRDEIARGQTAAMAARSVRTLLDRTGAPVERVAELLAAAERRDPAAVSAALDRANQDIGTAATIDDVLLPGMRQIGTWWETGRCDVGQEHLTTEVVRGWLMRLTAAAPDATHTGNLVLACGPEEQHTVGLEALVTLLSHDGYSCRVLGARTPQRALVTTVTSCSAVGAVVVSHLTTHRRPAVDAIRAVAETGCHAFYAGNAFHSPATRKAVPGTYLGTNLTFAAAMIGTARVR